MREERRLGGGGGGHRRPPAPPTGACTSKRLPPPPRPRAPTDAAAPRSASEDGPVPGARAGRCDPVPGTRASTGGRSADPHPAARPRHARGSHAGGVRSRVTVAARAQPGSPVGACAPPTDEYRTLLTQKSLAESRLTRRLFSQILGPHRATLEMSSRASRKVASPRVVCIEDLRPLARRRVPKAVFDYLDGGAEGEVTLRENCRAFEDVTFRPRHAVSISDCDLRTRVLGFDLSLPFLLAPVGYSRLMHPGGEVAAARAAGKAGTAYILSTISGHKLEDVKAGSSGPVFYQLYLMGGRAAAEAAIERARVARFAGLVVTIDTPVSGIRERDYRNGMMELISCSLLEMISI